MSLTTCALSGQLLNKPVVSKITGHVFEKSMIKKHLQITNQCPITGAELNEVDLLDLNTAKANPPSVTTQIPHLLQAAASCFDHL